MIENITRISTLIQRIIPNHINQITCEYIDSDHGMDVYEIDSKDGIIVLKGNSNSSIALALGQYLRHTAKVNLSWCGNGLLLPDRLPQPSYTRQIVEQKYRVYMNYCTFNYSASWWDFERWEKEIDFMALNGINMPLCAVGIEGIWYYTLLDIGFTDEEARSFIAGPAFLAWQNMTNLEGFGGKVSREWIDQRIELGRKIIDRMLSLDMHPIQQGFSGYVPTLLREKYPNSNIILKKEWCSVGVTAQLDPTDPLFMKLGKMFMKTQAKLFGLYGFYAADPFHEGTPPVEGDEYLHQVGKVIASLYEETDNNYIWVMQAWSIRKAIVEAVPQNRLLILDLNGSRYRGNDNFWGYPCVVGTLHNFGGRIKLHGSVKRLANNPYLEVKSHGANVVGTGLFMEGIEQNPMFYDLAFYMLTRNDTVNINDWIENYVYRRYQTTNIDACNAWNILLNSVYSEEKDEVEASSIICARPAVNVKKSGPNRGFVFNYDIKDLAKAVNFLLKVDASTDGYEFDLMDVTRQYLSDYGYLLYQKVSKSFQNKDQMTFEKYSAQFLELLSDIDRLLQHRKEYSLEKWIADARKCAAIPEEKDLFEYNASALITIWGKEESSNIFDYSWREWSGLIEQFYKLRWSFYFKRLSEYLECGIEYSEEGLPLVHGRECWRANELYSEMADMEIKWIRSRKTFDKAETGDLKLYVKYMINKYDI